MSRHRLLATLLAASFPLLAACAQRPNPRPAPPTVAAPAAGPVAPPVAAPVARWWCPMDCEKGKTYPAKGQCPICEMDLELLPGK